MVQYLPINYRALNYLWAYWSYVEVMYCSVLEYLLRNIPTREKWYASFDISDSRPIYCLLWITVDTNLFNFTMNCKSLHSITLCIWESKAFDKVWNLVFILIDYLFFCQISFCPDLCTHFTSISKLNTLHQVFPISFNQKVKCFQNLACSPSAKIYIIISSEWAKFTVNSKLKHSSLGILRKQTVPSLY